MRVIFWQEKLKDDRDIKMATKGFVPKAFYGEDIIRKHLKSDLKIIVDSEDINRQQRGQYDFIRLLSKLAF